MKSYLSLLDDVLHNGEEHRDRTGVGTYSVFGRQWRHDMRQGFPLLTTKKVPLRWVFEELRWFLSGTDDEQRLRDAGVDIWKEWATKEQCAKFGRLQGQLGPIYGPMMRSFPIGVAMHDNQLRDNSIVTSASYDQISALLQDIIGSPNARRLIVTHWHPYYAKRVTLPPCHTLWQVKVHEGWSSPDGRGEPDSMSLHLYCRSIDAFLGLPFNIASYGLLLHMLCAVTHKVPRDLIISFGDLHVYTSHLVAVKTQLEREPKSLPRLSLIDWGDPSCVVEGDEVRTALNLLLNMQWKNVKLDGYDPYSKIEAPVAV